MVFISLSAVPVDRQKAMSEAKAFLAGKGITMTLQDNTPRKAKRQGINSDKSYYYIFNASGNNGYVIVSGDDTTYPVIGYSDQGNIDPDNMPDGLKHLLDAYVETIDELNSLQEKGELTLDEEVAARRVKRAMSVVKQPVKPFLTKFWGHRAPYSNLNPVIRDTLCPTGCATVAVAEVMGFYSYPDKGPALSAYVTATEGYHLDALPETPFEWENMLSNYNIEQSNATQRKAVAKLMQYLGQYMKSDYQTTSTPATSNLMPVVLRALGYNTSSLTKSESKLVNDWLDIFYNNVVNHHPVIVSGSNIAWAGSGHVFILDGYDQDDYFHVDWGWTGDVQGYFRISEFSPYRNTIGYAYMRRLMFLYNIWPKGQGSSTSGTKPYTSLQLLNIYVKDGEIFTSRTNTSSSARTYEQGIALVGADNKMMRVLNSDTMTYKGSSSALTSWTIFNIGDVRDGTYRIYPVSRLIDGDGEWHFDVCNSANSCVRIGIKEGKASSLKALSAVIYNSFESDPSMGYYQGAVREMKLNLTNNMMQQLNKRLYFFEDDLPMHLNIARMPMCETGEVAFNYIPKTSGKHTLKLCTDTARTSILFQKEVTVSSAISYKLSASDLKIDNYDKEQKILYGNTLRARFKLTNTGSTTYDDYIRLLVKQTSWHDTRKDIIHLAPGESMIIEFESKDLAYGISHPFLFYYKSKSSDNSYLFNTTLINMTLKPRHGICLWDKDGKLIALEPQTEVFTMPEDAVAIDLTGLEISASNKNTPSSIVPNSNPNTLYYVEEPYASLEGHNQIVNSVAAQVDLTDGYSCYVPFDFKADSINYYRTFDKGFMGVRNENHWSTITLPFTVDKVYNTVDEKVVDWYKPADAGNDSITKDFWLREFVGEEGLVTYFQDAEKLMAAKPYIITVPGDYNGEEYSLVNKPLVFSATAADVMSGKVVADTQNHNFQGSYSETSTYGDFIYQLDEDDRGNNFVYVENGGTVQPFRAYFTSETKPNTGAALMVASYVPVIEATAVNEVLTDVVPAAGSLKGVYGITGAKIKVASGASIEEILRSLPSGIYIINGKKYLK